jgi:exodeoxyribonuclease X
VLNEFLSDRDIDIRFSARTELARRGDISEPDVAVPAQRTLL